MSLVITPMRSSPARARQVVAMSELLPTPTGPAMPRRSVLRRPSDVWWWCSMVCRSRDKEPSPFGCVALGPHLDPGCAERGEVARPGHGERPGDDGVDLRGQVDDPRRGGERVRRQQLERGGGDAL